MRQRSTTIRAVTDVKHPDHFLCPCTQAEARDTVLERLASIELADLPTVVGFLLQSVTPDTVRQVITALRLSLNVETFAAVEASTAAVTKDKGKGKSKVAEAEAPGTGGKRMADGLILGASRARAAGRAQNLLLTPGHLWRPRWVSPPDALRTGLARQRFAMDDWLKVIHGLPGPVRAKLGAASHACGTVR